MYFLKVYKETSFWSWINLLKHISGYLEKEKTPLAIECGWKKLERNMTLCFDFGHSITKKEQLISF